MSDPAAMAMKAGLRERYRRLRRALDPQRAASEAASTVARCLDLVSAAPALASYLALADELDPGDLHRAWWSTGRPLYVPRVCGPGRLTWHLLRADDVPGLGAFGIREPDPLQSPACELPARAAVIVPGIAFASDGRRLGQGAGYYDRALATHRGLTIGVGYSCQRCDDLPVEPHDRAVSAVVLGGEVLRVPPDTLPA
ncbi:MAG: 5-formyltetrahydrofolate cyclo-ligase [Planctomycetes bacterium]|nr:5-formyltetrahydrofolate cyclo-ligase [Planctomycetota bacterium]